MEVHPDGSIAHAGILKATCTEPTQSFASYYTCSPWLDPARSLENNAH